MARVIGKGSISFGLVQIPVGLYTAEKRNELSFSMLDARDMAPIGYRRVNKATGEEVPSDQIVKGFEVEPGEYVVVDDEDFKAANVEATQTVDILDFVDATAIDPMYFDKPYYLAPLRRGEKAYAILREALRQGGKVGIAKVVIRTKQHLAAVMVRGDVIVLEIMRFASEVRSPDEVEVPPSDLDALGVTDRELKMAHRLVEELTEEWQPDKYRDEYTSDLLALIEEKVSKGGLRRARHAAEARGGGELVDLMSLLKKSVEQADKRHAPEGKRSRGGRKAGK
jgi:DNA end-binding protein Ku